MQYLLDTAIVLLFEYNGMEKEKYIEENEHIKTCVNIEEFVNNYRMEGVKSIDVFSKDRRIDGSKCIRTLLDCSLRDKLPFYDAYRRSKETSEGELLSVVHSRALFDFTELCDEQILRLVQNSRIGDEEKVKLLITFMKQMYVSNPSCNRRSIINEQAFDFANELLVHIGGIPILSFVKAFEGSSPEFLLTEDERKMLVFFQMLDMNTFHLEKVNSEIYVVYLFMTYLLSGKSNVAMVGKNITIVNDTKGRHIEVSSKYLQIFENLKPQLRRVLIICGEITKIRSVFSLADPIKGKTLTGVPSLYREVHEEYLKEWSLFSLRKLQTMYDFSFQVSSATLDTERVEFIDLSTLLPDSYLLDHSYKYTRIRTLMIASEVITELHIYEKKIDIHKEYPSFLDQAGVILSAGDTNLAKTMVLDLINGMIDCGTGLEDRGDQMPFFQTPYHFFSLFPGGLEFVNDLHISLLYQMRSAYPDKEEEQGSEEEFMEEESVPVQNDELEDIYTIDEYRVREKSSIDTRTPLSENSIIQVQKSLFEVVRLQEGQDHTSYIRGVVDSLLSQYAVPEQHTLLKLPKYAKAFGWKHVKKVLRDEFDCEIKKSRSGTSHFKVFRKNNGKPRTATILAPDRSYYAKRAKYGTIKGMLEDLEIPEIIFWRAASGEAGKEEIIYETKEQIYRNV